ncbi:hypothetical protein DSCW_32030 [Desulfosarcina widdelii]|uniref:Uncharacterized protein n=1 Tax=Desulfosarcina widdelii TaxID=947919 RepID=A0A5K7Z274_9BACT|nr:hypothetical protein DSCW_32030 [Desulfosarcina widdelii]
MSVDGRDYERLKVVVAAVIKSALIGPWTFECWPGPCRAAAFSTMSRMTWRRNRDNLANRGLVELEHFGNGVAPIIYPIVPGLAYRSIFAPSNKTARKKKKGGDE